MQEHEASLKRTTAHTIASRVAALPDVVNGELTIEQTIGKMVGCGIIYRYHHEKSLLSDYSINYWHKSIPKDILADAPVEIKRSMAKTIDDMKSEQYMDDEGCVVTPNAVEKTGDPFAEDVNEMPEKVDIVEEDVNKNEELLLPEEDIKEICDKAVQPFADESSVVEEKPTTQEVSVPVQVKKDGKSMNITVNITLNL